MTQIMSKRQSVEITILPEGSMVHRHTSVMLDLKSRANEYEYMNIIVDEVRIFMLAEIFRESPNYPYTADLSFIKSAYSR